MFAGTSRFRENRIRNLLLFSGYALYTIVFSFLCIRFFGFLSFLRSSIFTISVPGVIITYMIADTTVSKHIFCTLSHLVASVYLIVSVTLLNRLFSGSTITNLLLLLSAYLVTILLELIFIRNAFLNIADMVDGSWRVLAPIPCSFFLLAMAIVVFPDRKSVG